MGNLSSEIRITGGYRRDLSYRQIMTIVLPRLVKRGAPPKEAASNQHAPTLFVWRWGYLDGTRVARGPYSHLHADFDLIVLSRRSPLVARDKTYLGEGGPVPISLR